MSEWKKNNSPNRKFLVDACMRCVFFPAAQKHMFVLQQESLLQNFI